MVLAQITDEAECDCSQVTARSTEEQPAHLSTAVDAPELELIGEMVADGTENWRLMLEAARALTAGGQTPFTRIRVYEWIWRRYPQSRRDRPSLDPTFQGMVRGATGGPKSLAGMPLIKTSRGHYVLAETVGEADAIRAAPPPPEGTPLRRIGASPLGEDQVKQGAKEFLEQSGFRVTVAWGHERGVDISAVSDTEILLLEAKGSAQNPPQQVNYFLGALGELLQRMTDPRAAYGLALPDNVQYRGLVDRLPALVWERLKFTALLVSKTFDDTYAVERILRHS